MATLDTLADRSTGSQIAGKAYFETSTNKFIVWNGDSWIELHSDGAGSVFTNNHSLLLDGVDDYGEAASPFQNPQLSVSLWLNFPQIVHQNYIIKTGQYALRYRVSSDGVTGGPWLQVSNYDVIKPGSAYANFTTTLNQWHHVATVSDGTTHKLFWNGQLLYTKTNSGLTIPTNTASSGYINVGSKSSRFWSGNVDEYGIWHSVLSDQDISDIYNNGSPDSLSSYNPLYWYRMGDDNNGSGPISDTQGNGADLVLNGPVVSSDTP